MYVYFFCLQKCVAKQCDWWRKLIVQRRTFIFSSDGSMDLTVYSCHLRSSRIWWWQNSLVVGAVEHRSKYVIFSTYSFFYEQNKSCPGKVIMQKPASKTSHPWHDSIPSKRVTLLVGWCHGDMFGVQAQVAGTFGSFKYDRESRVPWTWKSEFLASSTTTTRWWFQIFSIFTPNPGEMESNLTVAYFSDGLVKNHQPD